MIHVITHFGAGSRILHKSKQHGVLGGTVLLGKGTVSGQLFKILGLDREEKEIVLMASGEKTAKDILEMIGRDLKLDRPGHGIAYTTSIHGYAGTSHIANKIATEEKREDKAMYHEITVIVDKGKAEDVIEAAVKAGSKGGTIINARGSGIHETSRLFSMDIEPEKEMVIILSETESTDSIVSLIRMKLNLDEPGNGILFIQNVNRALGIYKN